MKLFQPVEVELSQEALDAAQPHAIRRAKRTSWSPALAGDEDRPDRDYTAVVCEFAYYQWRYNDWRIRDERLQTEVVRKGKNDGGEDDTGVNVRGSYLAPYHKLERMHLLVSVDATNAGKCYPHIWYVAGFYEKHQARVWLAGFQKGERIARYPVTRVKADGFDSYCVPVTELQPMVEMPRRRLAAAG